MSDTLPGLHHVTAVTADAQRNIKFYTDVLGLRFVKKTVNFDDPGTYHLYFGNETGEPGTALTFFAFDGAQSGTVGRGQVSGVTFAAPAESIDFWAERLRDHDVDVTGPSERFGEEVLSFDDPDGHPLEIIGSSQALTPWESDDVPAEYGLRGFHSVTLNSWQPGATRDALDVMGYDQTEQQGDRSRFRASDDFGALVDLVDRPEDPRGRPGAGTVHHVAFRTPDTDTQDQWKQQLEGAGLRVTDRKDRHYFQSIYYREPGRILFEIATEGPGFTRDESVDELGSSLKLPPWLEGNRDGIISSLPEL